MRCPRCKTPLLASVLRECSLYILGDTKIMMRPSYVCPRGCYEEAYFFDETGKIHGSKDWLVIKDAYALDSHGRREYLKFLLGIDSGDPRFEIVDLSYKQYSLWDKFRCLLYMKIPGEKDVPNFWILFLRMIHFAIRQCFSKKPQEIEMMNSIGK